MMNISEPDIIVVIPAKNESRYIARCLNGVLCQTYSSFAVVVVDNGSHDDTKDIVKSFSNVNLLEKEGGTISSVRNFGAKFLKSKYIAFLDGDCVPPSSWLQTGLELLSDAQVSCVGFPATPPSVDDSWVSKTWHMLSSSVKHKNTCFVNWLSSFNLIIKRDFFEKVGGFNEALETCEDYDLGIKLSKISRLLYSDRLSVHHLGVVNSLKEFFLKELWRGKSNFKQLKNNKEGLSEIIKSIIPSIYVLLTLLLMVFSIFFYKFFIILLLVLVGTPCLFAGSRLRRFRQIVSLPKMILVAGIYLFARGFAVIGK